MSCATKLAAPWCSAGAVRAASGSTRLARDWPATTCCSKPTRPATFQAATRATVYNTAPQRHRCAQAEMTSTGPAPALAVAAVVVAVAADADVVVAVAADADAVVVLVLVLVLVLVRIPPGAAGRRATGLRAAP